MALQRGQTPRPYVTPDHAQHPQHPQYPQHPQQQMQRQQTPRPIHGDYDAYGPNAYGGRARRTIPMSYWPPLDDDIEVQIRGRCQHCQGRGIVAGYDTRCPVGTCRRRYSQETIASLARFGFRGRRMTLPCHHEVTQQELLWIRRRCDICEGDGYLYRYMRWGDFVGELYGEEELDEQTTSALRALGRAQSARESRESRGSREPVDPFSRSGEPTAPTPPPPQLSESYSQSYGERMTPVINHHLPPLAPERDSGESF